MNAKQHTTEEQLGHQHESDLEIIRHAEVEITDRIQEARAAHNRKLKQARSTADQIRSEAERESRDRAEERYQRLVSEYQHAAEEMISEAHHAAQALRERFSQEKIEAEADAVLRMVLARDKIDNAD